MTALFLSLYTSYYVVFPPFWHQTITTLTAHAARSPHPPASAFESQKKPTRRRRHEYKHTHTDRQAGRGRLVISSQMWPQQDERSIELSRRRTLFITFSSSLPSEVPTVPRVSGPTVTTVTYCKIWMNGFIISSVTEWCQRVGAIRIAFPPDDDDDDPISVCDACAPPPILYLCFSQQQKRHKKKEKREKHV